MVTSGHVMNSTHTLKQIDAVGRRQGGDHPLGDDHTATSDAGNHAIARVIRVKEALKPLPTTLILLRTTHDS